MYGISESRQAALEFGMAFRERFGRTAYDTALRLLAISHRLHMLDEHACNYGRTEAQQKRTARLKQEAQELIEDIKPGSIAYHQGDPRGWSLYLLAPEDVKKDSDIRAYYNQGLGVPVR